MSTASVPTGHTAAPAAPNPLGRVALIIGLIGVVGMGVWTIVQPLFIQHALSDPANMSSHSIVMYGVHIANVVVTLAATILGVIACRRPGRSKVAGAIAIGIGGSTLVSYVFLLISTVFITSTFGM